MYAYIYIYICMYIYIHTYKLYLEDETDARRDARRIGNKREDLLLDKLEVLSAKRGDVNGLVRQGKTYARKGAISEVSSVKGCDISGPIRESAQEGCLVTESISNV